MTVKEARDYLQNHEEVGNEEQNDAIDLAVTALWFSEFVAHELFDDEWEFNSNHAFIELACRRLVKLGLVKNENGRYSLIDSDDKK